MLQCWGPGEGCEIAWPSPSTTLGLCLLTPPLQQRAKHVLGIAASARKRSQTAPCTHGAVPGARRPTSRARGLPGSSPTCAQPSAPPVTPCCSKRRCSSHCIHGARAALLQLRVAARAGLLPLAQNTRPAVAAPAASSSAFSYLQRGLCAASARVRKARCITLQPFSGLRHTGTERRSRRAQ